MGTWNGKAIFGVMLDYILESDARLWGWGAFGDVSATGGRWTREEQLLHINCVELFVGSFTVHSFTSNSSDCCVLLGMHNISV